MGFDVYGRKATAPEGEYFRRSVWGWRRLAALVVQLAPSESNSCHYWQSNDGDGLNKAQSIKLADKLDQLLAEGTIARHIAVDDAEIGALPRVVCFCCNGKGIRDDAIGKANGWDTKKVTEPADNPRLGQIGSCNACYGWGTRPDDATHYSVSVDDVKEFVAFIRASGGFKIH